jgi:hypothetical protein
MKKYTPPAAWTVILSGLLFVFACNKSGRPPYPANAAGLCPIKEVIFSTSLGMDTITFLYDGLGRPVNTTATIVEDGIPRYQFRYDGQGRLKDYIGVVRGYSADSWTRYTYSADNRTIWDTTYTVVPEDTSWPPNLHYGSMFTHVKKYDREGRVIQIITPIIPPIVYPDTIITETIQNITYDSRGDVEGFVYDDKINYHQTNKVWMQINDQYSVNNPLGTGKYIYDRYGLPVQFADALFLQATGFGAIEYGCDLSKGLATAK